MSKSSVLQVKGFESLLEKVKAAQGDVVSVTTKLANESVDIIYDDLKNSAATAGVPKSVTDEMKKERATWQGNICSAGVGWKLGSFDSNNPSQGYKAIFMNYGTPRRSRHGKIQGRFFISRAKKISKRKVKRAQEETVNKIIGELK